MPKRMSGKELMWKRRNMNFLMVFGPVMVLVFTIFAILVQYRINLKAINEGLSVGFQFEFIFPVVMGLSFWIIALLCKCQILEDRIAAIEEKHDLVK